MDTINWQNIWELLAGIGIFLFGMYLLEESIRLLSGATLKKLIRNYTNKPVKAIATGAVSTAVLQSSSAVTLMVLAFAGAGIMQMTNAVGVIFGANIGTTFTSWIVALLGFKFSIEALALPFIAIGGLGLIFMGKSGKSLNISKLLVGFGFLFMGLDYMKRSVEEAASQFSLESFQDANVFIFVLIGFALTALVQSSSAAMAIILSGIHSSLIDFDMGAAMVIGSNMGTTVTVIVGSIGGNVVKKQIAWSHFIFNFFTGFLAILLLPFFSLLINTSFSLSDDPVTGLALFHTLFNTSGVLIFGLFLNRFVKFIKKIVPEKSKSTVIYLPNASAKIPEAALVALTNEVQRLIYMSMLFQLRIFNIRSPMYIKLNEKFEKYSDEHLYDEMKEIQDAIFVFASEMQHEEIEKENALELSRSLHAARYATISAKSLKDVLQHLLDIKNSDNSYLHALHLNQKMDLETVFEQLIEIKNNEEVLNATSELLRLNLLWKENDRKFAEELMLKLKLGQIKQQEVSNLLSLQRGYTQALRQIIAAHRDLLLNNEQQDTLDKIS